jgi:hypothetical protein
MTSSVPIPPHIKRVTGSRPALGSLGWHPESHDVSSYSVIRQRTIWPGRFHEESEDLRKGELRLVPASLTALVFFIYTGIRGFENVLEL